MLYSRRFLPKVDEDEQVPVSFRYNVTPLESKRTNVFRPNPLGAEAKANSLGALFIGKWDRVPQNEMVDILWEARPMSSKYVCFCSIWFLFNLTE